MSHFSCGRDNFTGFHTLQLCLISAVVGTILLAFTLSNYVSFQAMVGTILLAFTLSDYVSFQAMGWMSHFRIVKLMILSFIVVCRHMSMFILFCPCGFHNGHITDKCNKHLAQQSVLCYLLVHNQMAEIWADMHDEHLLNCDDTERNWHPWSANRIIQPA